MLKKELLNDMRTKIVYDDDNPEIAKFTTPCDAYKYNYYAFAHNTYEYSDESSLYSQICTNNESDLEKWIDDVKVFDGMDVKTIEEFTDDDIRAFTNAIFIYPDLKFIELKLPSSAKTKNAECLYDFAHEIFQMYVQAMIDVYCEDSTDFDFSFSYDSTTGIFNKKVRHGNVITEHEIGESGRGRGVNRTYYVD